LSYEINIDMDVFELYCGRFISTSNILNHTLQSMRPKLELFKEELGKAFSLNTKNLPDFTNLAMYACGVYATVMYFDFHLEGFLAEQPFVESCVLPTVADLDIKEFMDTILKEICWCRKSFDLFEIYPMYEEEFYGVMGPEASLINENLLTLEQVQDIVNGVITAEDLLSIHESAIQSEKETEAAESLGVNQSGIFQ